MATLTSPALTPPADSPRARLGRRAGSTRRRTDRHVAGAARARADALGHADSASRLGKSICRRPRTDPGHGWCALVDPTAVSADRGLCTDRPRPRNAWPVVRARVPDGPDRHVAASVDQPHGPGVAAMPRRRSAGCTRVPCGRPPARSGSADVSGRHSNGTRGSRRATPGSRGARDNGGWWAVRDSNPRHPRCKRGALTN